MPRIHPSISDVAQHRVGTRVRGKYRVDKLLGVGGMGAVYAATHRNGSKVALKVLHPQLSMLGDIRARFAREGYVANAVNHPGVVRVIDDDETEDGAVFLVMELLEGDTAEARARRFAGRLPVEEVVTIADGLLSVLAAAHDAGIVHRDIKPENVFLTNEGVVKVLDFGIARLRAASIGEDMDVEVASAMPHLRTRTGVTLGTPAFMPPEQALGRTDEVDALSDLWAVGATMFALLTGRIVHDVGTHMEIVIAAATAQARSVAAVAPDLPTGLVAVVDKALAFKREDRWPSAAAMLEALRAAVPQAQPGSVKSIPGSEQPVSFGLGSQPPLSSMSSGGWAEERKLATVLSCDLAGVMALANELEPDALRELTNAFFDPLAREVEREGGTVVKFVADGMLAVFGVPVAHEDDPSRAVRAALAMKGKVRELALKRGCEISLRAGIHTGLVMVGTVGGGSRAAPDIIGAAVNLAARVASAAQPGQVLVSSATERHLHDRFELDALSPVSVPGLSEPLQMLRVEAEREEDPASSVRLRSASGTPFFARHLELELLMRIYDAVELQSALRVVEVSGEMGLGKGHLLRQLRTALGARQEPPLVLHATRMLGVAPLGFVGKMLRARFNVRADEAPEAVRARVVDVVAEAWAGDEIDDGREAGRLLADLVAPTPVAPMLETELSNDSTRTIGAFADWVRRLARARPVVMLVEQVQWSDQGSLDLLQYVIRALRRERVLLVVSARPEPTEQLPSWLTGCDVRTRIDLAPFSEEVMERFLDDLFRNVTNFPREMKREIIRRAEGNPELCKELVRLLVDRGQLTVDPHHVPIRWNGTRTARLELPDTVRGVLQARLDGLVPMQKEILKMASVIGRVFWVGALRELLPDLSLDELSVALDGLRGRELVKPQPSSSVSGEREYTFVTQVLCDAAYELVPRTACVLAHRKIADWLGERGELWEGGHANLASHLEAAGEHARARRLFLSAARQAVSVCAYQEAVGFFDRVQALWQKEPTHDDRIARAGVMRERAAAEGKLGRFDEAIASLAQGEADLRAAGVDPADPVYAWLMLERGVLHKEHGRLEESLEVLSRAIEMVESTPPSLLHMRLRAARAFQLAAKGEHEAAGDDCKKGLALGQQLHMRDATWHVAVARLKDAEGSLALFTGRLDDAERAYREALELRELAGDAQGMPDGYVNLGGVAFTRGDHAAAASYYERALAAAKKARWASREAIGHSNLGQARLALGELDVAASELETACRLADEGGYLDVLADASRALAECELTRGRAVEAVARAVEAVEHAARAENPYFEAMAHATAMDAYLLSLASMRKRTDFENARVHKDRACDIFTDLGRPAAAEGVKKRFGQGSNATVDT
ncbi:MAG: protein kinase [Myxococcales bacterium]|nr:protein kinase [Myxococcales bacterium]